MISMVSVNLKSLGWKHSIWLLYVCLFVFVVPYLLDNVIEAPIDLYCLIFLAGSIAFIAIYRHFTFFEIRASLNSGWALGSIMAVFIGLGFISFAADDSRKIADSLEKVDMLIIIWRGVVFGGAAGIMISAFPFVIVWRSFAGSNPGKFRKFSTALAAGVSIAVASFCNHLGKTGLDREIMNNQIEKNIVAGLPTLLSGNPLAAPVAGAFLSVSELMKLQDELQRPIPGGNEIANTPRQTGGAN